MTITLNLQSESLDEGQTIEAGAILASHSDSRRRALTKFAVYDNGADGGQFELNGVSLSDGQWHRLTAAQVAKLDYVAGPGVGSETLEFKAYDGAWSRAYSTTVSTVASPNANIVSLFADPGIAADVGNLMANDSLSYDAMLTVLQDAAVGGMTSTKFSTLQTLASLLNAPNGIAVSSYVQQIADDVIDGNSANAQWNGGASSAVALGDLTSASSQTQANELIGKWFLGADLPSLDLSGIGEQNLNPTYAADTAPLFGASGAPNYLDVNQGYLGDCYFMSSLGETALQDPAAIESMISSNGNGTDSVRFYVDGVADYVTVNDDLPVMAQGYSWADGSNLEFANGATSWVPLIEKAFVELNEQTNAAEAGGHPAGNAYEDINGGTSAALTELTNQSVDTYNLSSGTSSTTLNAILSTLAADWSSGDELLMSTPNASNGNLVGDHMYEVTGVNLAAGTVSVQNPWNTAYSGSIAMSFTDTIKQLANDGCALYATTGHAVA